LHLYRGTRVQKNVSQAEFVGDVGRFPPIKFDNIIDFVSVEKRTIPEASYKARSMMRV